MLFLLYLYYDHTCMLVSHMQQFTIQKMNYFQTFMIDFTAT